MAYHQTWYGPFHWKTQTNSKCHKHPEVVFIIVEIFQTTEPSETFVHFLQENGKQIELHAYLGSVVLNIAHKMKTTNFCEVQAIIHYCITGGKNTFPLVMANYFGLLVLDPKVEAFMAETKEMAKQKLQKQTIF